MKIEEMRKEIDSIDSGILDLFLRRMEISGEIAQYKKEHGLPILNSAREREVLAEAEEKSGDLGLYSYELFSTIMSLSKARQSELMSGPSEVRRKIEEALSHSEKTFPKTGTVACQGVEGSYSQTAAEKFIPRGKILHMSTFDAVFRAVQSGLCDFGVVPIENSSNGSVRTVYELLQKYRLTVVRSAKIWIHHCLLAKPGTDPDSITTIYSHEQAIGQCSEFIEKLGKVKVVPCENTAVAAERVAGDGDPHSAAIASQKCADLYGLRVIGDRIQNSENNYTRFVCIEKESKIYAGANRTCIIISCENKPGALYSIMSKPAALGINMVKLESCPVSGRNFEFLFFIELECSAEERGAVPMFEELERECESFYFLGSYQEI
ncbi:MAG: bifunctional chorismate mutase/prephenate dehydratase [Oscillospiraceae bacterium]|jgi:chorismate mutase/prephenate dehydratase